MQIDPEKIREHADARLSDVPAETAARIHIFKRFLRLETDRLRMQHRFGLGGTEIAEGRSHVVDIVVGRACQLIAEDLGAKGAAEIDRCAVVAVGGYGRGELAPFSDVDLLFLHPHGTSKIVQIFVEKVLALLWDIGLEVGHSFRTVGECVEMGLEDLHSRNSMSDARLLGGSENLFGKMQGEMQACVYDNHRATEDFLKEIRRELKDRLARYGEAVCMLEPNVKEGAGGLRDLHVMGWVGRTRFRCRDVDELAEGGHMSQGERTRALRAYDFISRARNEIHFETGRKTEALSLELQPTMAEAFGYEPKRGMEPSEIFMRDYYRRAQDLHMISEGFLVRSDVLSPPASHFFLLRLARKVGPGRRYEIRSGRLYSREEKHDFGGSGEGLLEVFEVAQAHGVAVSAALKHQVHRNLRLVTPEFRKSPQAARRFLTLLAQEGRIGSTARAMHESGFLGRYLPPFGRIALLVQHDHYHRYTIDEHTLRALETLDALVHQEGAEKGETSGADAGALASALEEVHDMRRLALAILLHDVGKGRGGGHVSRGARIARRTAERLGLDEEAASDVAFLVRKHLVMSQVSQRRDLSDPTLVQAFAETVSTTDRLDMLFLLTYADTNAVGPGIWTDWKASLLTELYSKARSHLAGGPGPASEKDPRTRREEKIVAEMLPEYLRRDVDEFLEPLPDRYLRVVTPDLIARHFQMVRDLGSHSLAADWRTSPDGLHTLLSLCLHDSPGALARLAGTLTASGLDILSVNAFTRTDGVVLDVFVVAEADESEEGLEARYAEIEAALAAALEGRADVEAAVAKRWTRRFHGQRKRAPSKPAVRFDTPDALGRTVIEVRADDEPGLLYRITTCLSKLGLDISFAKIATEKNQALDVFYVSDGHSLGPADLSRIETALLEALSARPTTT